MVQGQRRNGDIHTLGSEGVEMLKGSHHSPEAIAKNRASNTGKKLSESTKAKMSLALTGNTHTKGHALTEEHKTKISLGGRGKSRSDETKARISLALRNRVQGPETREKIRLVKIGNTHVRDASIRGDCVYCFGPANTFDHVIPRGRQGWDDPENIVPACRWCNTSKRDSTPEEWWNRIWETRIQEPK